MKKVFSISLFFMLIVSIGIFAAVRTASVSGDWNNTATWGGASVPVAADDVTINAEVTVTVNGVYSCASLTLGNGDGTANLIFSGSNPALTVTGSVSVGVTGGNGKLAGDITFINGSTLIANSLTLVGTKTNISQIIMTAGGTLNVGSLNIGSVGGGSDPVWAPGAGTVELTATNALPTTIFTTFNNLTISGGTTTLDIDIALTGNWTYSSTSNSIGGTGNVSLAGNFTNNNASLDVTTTEFTFNGTSAQTIYSASTPLPATTTFGNLVIDKPSGTIQLLSDVAVENTFTETNGTLDENGYTLWVNGSPLPVELSSFSAVILENRIKLKWRTETEVSNYGFEIERALSDSQNLIWGKIGFVEGHGNSNSPKEYNFIDSEVNSAGTYSYRLKQIDNDGTYDLSKTIEVNFGSPIKFELNQNYPNPFNPSTTISFSLPESGKVILKIYNVIGKEIKTLVDGYREAGIYTVNFNAEGLPSGMYIYQMSTPENTQVRKMILMK